MTANNTIKPAAVQSSTATTIRSGATAGNIKNDNKQYYPSNNNNKQDTTTSSSKPTIKIST